MPTFERGDVVRAPFPYTDRDTRQYRPAVVVSDGVIGQNLVWIVMVTSAENRPWSQDLALGERYGDCGLPVPSVVRPVKITTVDASRIERVGALPLDLLAEVEQALQRALGR
ncbi:MAG: type II toxin-antitoxin system PemK/MazF family toxin [Brevundimonas sp.]|uniref:type II toxin-antitoxin system PemK/MazF family toxin n=1 Tax=Brevundimonas sp. TaxID=1871086 RepID=UPI0025C20244|nr:type II toxin-antitoxin system PemK/MazF family toxin [Brevundimonas sp.]MBX3476618.1 type II toxin-antitoxin system PemK/MazF family toxin [Brevundimonas sp.]